MNINYTYKHNDSKHTKKEKPYIIEIKEDNECKVPCDISFIDSEGCVRLIRKGTSEPLYLLGVTESGQHKWGKPDEVRFIDDSEKLNDYIDELPDDGNIYLVFVRNKNFYEQGKLIRDYINGGKH